MFPALCTIMVIEMFEFSKQRGNPHRKLQTIIFNWFRLSRDNYWRGEVEIVRESDEDVESEIERSIFNIVMLTRVGREKLFTCPVEWEIFSFQMNWCTCIQTVSISAAFHLLCACHQFPANNHWEWDLDQTWDGDWDLVYPASGPSYNIVVILYKYPNCGSVSSIA